MVKPTPQGATRSPTSRRAAPRRVAMGLALGLPLGVACSLSLDLDDQIPCSSDSECMYTNGQGSCQEGFCVPPGNGGDTDATMGTTMTPDPSTTGPGTTVSLDSTTTADESSSGSSSTTEGPPPVCVVNSDCNDDQRCDTDTETCVDLLSEECNILRWPTQGMGKDNVVFLGSIMPTSPPFDTLVEPLQNALQLAIDDFNQYATLQGGARIAWVGCDSTGGASVAVSAAEHLRDNVEVPAIVGPVFSEATRQVAENVTVPADIFLISPTASAPSLSNFDDNNLVWRVTPNDVYQGNALIDRFTLDLGIDPTASRVLVLSKDDAYGNELRDLIATDLVSYFDNVYFDSYPGPETFMNMADLLASYGAIIGQALAQPGVTAPAMYANPEDHYTHIIILGTSEAEAFIVSYLGAWAQNYFTFNMAIPLPLFTVSHGAVPQMEQIVANVGVTPGTEALAPFRPLLYANMRGTAPNIFDENNFTAFNIRYQIAFGGQQALTSSSLSYDAGLAAMFAMVTVDEADQPITGTAVANGMASLNDAAGTAISFGDQVPDFVQDARNALASGNTVDLQGVSGALNWDPTNGELRADVLGWSLIGDPADPQLNPACIYALNPDPAEDGTWVNLSTGMPPCG